jgi:hypothetical protein
VFSLRFVWYVVRVMPLCSVLPICIASRLRNVTCSCVTGSASLLPKDWHNAYKEKARYKTILSLGITNTFCVIDTVTKPILRFMEEHVDIITETRELPQIRTRNGRRLKKIYA